MSTIKTNTITDVAGSGGPTLTNGATFGTAAFAAPSGSAPIYACRAWVKFNGTGTPSVLGGGNVSSITDSGVGLYSVNFTNAMPDVNYGYALSVYDTAAVTFGGYADSLSTSAIRVRCKSGSGTAYDYSNISVQIFR